jgi:hypothetical protein
VVVAAAQLHLAVVLAAAVLADCCQVQQLFLLVSHIP